MNYKKSIAFVLALTMCVSVVASNISLVSDNIGIYADSTENDGSVSYEHVYTYNTELETTKDDYGYSIDVTNVDSVQIVIDSDSYIGFNGVFDDNWNNTEWLQGVPNDSNVVILTTSTKGSSKLYLQTTNDLKVYIGKPIGIKTTKTLSSTDILDTTDYSSMVANYVYDGTLESGLCTA